MFIILILLLFIYFYDDYISLYFLIRNHNESGLVIISAYLGVFVS